MKTFVWVVAVIIIIVGIGSYFYSNRASTTSSAQKTTIDGSQNTDIAKTSSDKTGNAQATIGVPMTATVVHGQSGFSPSTVTIAKGDTVVFKNHGGDGMWVASNPHPTHESYSGTTKNQHCPDTAGVAFDQCSVGTTYSFTFKKIGTWSYHNHLNASEQGTVIVK